MKKVLLVSFLVSLCLVFVGTYPVVSASEGADNGDDRAGLYPEFGFGSQFVYPSGGLSSRVWLTSRLGGEFNAILWSDSFTGVNGTVSLRLLSKLSDGDVVDFYVAAGSAYNFDPNYSRISFVGTGGISFRIFSDSFRLNLEFGMQGQGVDRFGPTFGSGFHYYF